MMRQRIIFSELMSLMISVVWMSLQQCYMSKTFDSKTVATLLLLLPILKMMRIMITMMTMTVTMMTVIMKMMSGMRVKVVSLETTAL